MPRLDGPVLVTGATGFIGRHVCDALALSGTSAHAAVRVGSSRARPGAAGVTTHEMRDASAEIADVIAAVRPTAVVHLATMFVAQHRPDAISRMVEANVTFGTAVADATSKIGARLVHATSAWQHLGGAEYSPVSLYAATKQALVDVLTYYAEAEGLDSSELCLFDTYGPRDDRGKLVSVLLDHALSGAPLPMSSGRQLVDLTHVSDVVRAVGVLLGSPTLSGRLVVRSGHPLTVRALADLVSQVTGRPLDIRWGERPERPREMVSDWPVSGMSTPWRPETALEDGLAQLWKERLARA